MPIVLPLTWGVLAQNGMADPQSLDPIYLSVVACVLAGSVWGDHCSPISDTTILSSMSTSCDHLEHVRTQLPYAMVVGGVSLFLGIIPVALGLPIWAGLIISAIVVILIPMVVGTKLNERTL